MTSNPSTAQARAVVDELCRRGVRHAVLCPGSRSAPLALALAAADEAGRLRLHVRIDERAAGFLALGLARGSGAPVPIVVTSGTAVANLHPAMVEAAESGVPLLAVTANRPPELWGSGANQTIDQVGIFGPHARAVVSMPLATDPSATPDPEPLWRSVVSRACWMTAATAPGPVQLDIPFAAPLVPAAGDEQWPGAATGPAPADCPLPAVPPASVPADLRALGAARRPVVIAGGDAAPVPGLAHLPTVAEPGFGPVAVPVHPLALPALDPDCVVVLGRPTLHRAVTALLARTDLPIVVVAGPTRAWFDPGGVPVVGPVEAAAVAAAAPDPESLAPWREEVAAVTQRAEQAVGAELEDTTSVLGLHVAAAVAEATCDGDLLFVGASNPVRDLALLPAPRACVVANRGAAGIDGTIATATGFALATGCRTIALLGDVTFCHDVGSLAIAPGEPRPDSLTVVVADDSGGGIFSLLEQGEARLARHFDRVFGTPQQVSIAALCAGYQVAHRAVSLAELPAALAEPADGIRVLEVATDRAPLRARHARMTAAARDVEGRGA